MQQKTKLLKQKVLCTCIKAVSVGGNSLTEAVSILHMILFQLDFGIKSRSVTSPVIILKNIGQVDSNGTSYQRTVVKKLIEN